MAINTFTLKMIAIIAMFIDHLGAVIFPEYIELRIIGRIAFPIFAYTLVEGFVYTHDVFKYMKRLGVLALLSEIPFDLAFFGTPLEFGHQNVFFTLFLGILMLYLLINTPSTFRKMVLVIAMFLLSEFMPSASITVGTFEFRITFLSSSRILLLFLSPHPKRIALTL